MRPTTYIRDAAEMAPRNSATQQRRGKRHLATIAPRIALHKSDAARRVAFHGHGLQPLSEPVVA